MARLGDLCTKSSSNIAQKDLENCNGEYPIYGASGFIKNVNFYKQEHPYVAVVKDGAGVGRVMKLPEKSSVIGTMQYIIPNNDIDVSYLAYAMEHMNLAKYCSGATIPHIYFKDYCNETLTEHSPLEQKHIVDVLGKVTDLIAKHKRQLELLDELVKAKFVEMFGDKNNYTSSTLNDVCSIITDGTHQPPMFETSGIPFIFVSNIAKNEITYNTDKYISEETYNQLIKRTPIEIGDVLLSTVGSYGHPAVVKSNARFLFQRHIAYLKPDYDIINSIYLYGFFLSSFGQKQIEERVKGIAQKTLNLTEIKKIQLAVPPLKLQQEFADFVEQTDKSKSQIAKSLEQLETLKKALMQKYFG